MEKDISIIQVGKPSSIEELAFLLKEQGDKIRKLKEGRTNWQEDEQILDEIWKHLALKQFDPILGAIPEEHRGKKTIKLRWRICEYGKKENVSKRFQNIFPDRFWMTGKEVFEAIHKHMTKPKILQKYPYRGLLKLELIQKATPTKPKVTIALTERSILRMPLSFPGPWLADTCEFEIRVFVAGERYHHTTPVSYHGKIYELVDSGVNMFSKELHNLNLVIERSFRAGVGQLLCISTNLETSKHSLGLSKQYVHSLVAMAGVHPIYVKTCLPSDENEQELRNLINENRQYIVAVGECGLDSEKENLDDEKKNLQLDWFKRQMNIANDFKLPLFVHERGCHDECVQLLREFVKNSKEEDPVIVINCFTGNRTQLKNYLSLPSKNVYIVITGIICEDRGEHLREFVSEIPEDRLLLATDAPHLTPFNMSRPFPRRNEPGFLGHVLAMVADTTGRELKTVSETTTNNARRAFRLPEVYFEGTCDKLGDIVITELQKIEDERMRGGNKSKKAAPNKIVLEANKSVFVLKGDNTERAFIVNDKERSILEKQQKSKTFQEIVDLAQILEVSAVEPNTIVMNGENIAYTNVEQLPQ
eukprot:TRINITY_DN9622_c0_g1_i1.p1 TRINITY_DN9622_c0_g1~~TRINITY_DN9622_c0_g1_i1.p1  ORF type:complete len:589 (+),score=151.49 TRINITY_DN9622_c0_g1_i1:57-1823(+)